MSDIYKTQQLVNAGFDFAQVFPEKQEYIQEKFNYDFRLPEVVSFMQQQTSDFTIDNPVARDLDGVVVKTINKWAEVEGQPNPFTPEGVEIVPEGEPVEPVTVPVEEPAEASSDVDEWKEAVEGLKMLIEMGGEEAEITEWTDAHEGLIMLLEMEGVDVSAFKVEMREGGTTFLNINEDGSPKTGDTTKGYYVEWKEGDQKIVEKYGAEELQSAKDLYRQQKEYGYPAVITTVADGTVVMGKEFKKGGSTYAGGGGIKPFDKKGNPTKEYVEYRKNNLQKLKDELAQMTYHKDEWDNKQEYLDYQKDLKGQIKEEEDFISKSGSTYAGGGAVNNYDWSSKPIELSISDWKNKVGYPRYHNFNNKKYHLAYNFDSKAKLNQFIKDSGTKDSITQPIKYTDGQGVGLPKYFLYVAEIGSTYAGGGEANKQEVVDAVLEQMQRNVADGDITVEEELFLMLPQENLIQALPEEESENFKSKDKQEVVDAVLEQMKRNVADGDITVEEELFLMLPKENLIQALPEEEWEKYSKGGSTYAGGGETKKKLHSTDYVLIGANGQPVEDLDTIYSEESLVEVEPLEGQKLVRMTDLSPELQKKYSDYLTENYAGGGETSTFVEWFGSKTKATSQMKNLQKKNPNKEYFIKTVGRGDHELHCKN
jgi:hypothetical protein